jgi:hypothetical protein
MPTDEEPEVVELRWSQLRKVTAYDGRVYWVDVDDPNPDDVILRAIEDAEGCA